MSCPVPTLTTAFYPGHNADALLPAIVLGSVEVKTDLTRKLQQHASRKTAPEFANYGIFSVHAHFSSHPLSALI